MNSIIIKLTSLPMCGFIALLVEHRTGIAEVTCSNPVKALSFLRVLLSTCLNWTIYCDDHSSHSVRNKQRAKVPRMYDIQNSSYSTKGITENYSV